MSRELAAQRQAQRSLDDVLAGSRSLLRRAEELQREVIGAVPVLDTDTYAQMYRCVDEVRNKLQVLEHLAEQAGAQR